MVMFMHTMITQTNNQTIRHTKIFEVLCSERIKQITFKFKVVESLKDRDELNVLNIDLKISQTTTKFRNLVSIRLCFLRPTLPSYNFGSIKNHALFFTTALLYVKMPELTQSCGG